MRDRDLSAARRAAGQAVLDRLPYALLVVDERVHPVAMNARAREQVRRGFGLDDARLRTAVVAATSPTASWLVGATALTLTVGDTEVQAVVVPALIELDPLLGRRGLALIALGDDERTPPGTLLTSMYGFTRRESDVARALMHGQNVAEAALALDMTRPTVRTHLRRLLDKTGTTGQTELLRILLRSAP
jgi:DNA-binding CsgD family transcriptional regulator